MEALENFFAHMPSDCNMAFVIVQHLDPHHKSMMDFLLAKQTHLKRSDAADRVRVQPGQVYLKPPGKDMIMRNRTLHLQKARPKGKRLQIDTFFRSLATDQKEKAICVILSGASNDGTPGARMIKGEGGLVVVQDEKQAQYNSMPRSLIDAGVTDIILPVEEIPSELLRYTQHPFLDQEPADTPEEEFEKNIGAVLMMFRALTGHDFSGYKRNTVRRRIERRMALHQIHELSDYGRYLRQNARSPALRRAEKDRNDKQVADLQRDLPQSRTTLQNIDEQKQAQMQLAAKLAELEQKNQELHQFAYAVSHDLKAPLRAIRNYSDFLFEDLAESLSGEQKNYLGGLKLAASQGRKLIDDLLTYSRIGRTLPGAERINMPAMIREVKSFLQLSSDMDMSVQKDWPVFESDPMLLSQILKNLVTNAIKFNQSGSKEFEGTGIGLAIVKKAALEMGGAVRVESHPAEGSTFYVQIPNRVGTTK